MPLKTLVKVGGLTNLSDARYCAGMGVDMIGFQVIPGQPNYIEPARYQEIRGWVSGPLIVAEIYGLHTEEEVATVLANYKPDYLELSLTEAKLISNYPLPYILRLYDKDTVPEYAAKPTMVLITTGRMDIDRIPLLLAVESPEEALASLSRPNVKGISMMGSPEIKPGLKIYDEVASILEVLEED